MAQDPNAVPLSPREVDVLQSADWHGRIRSDDDNIRDLRALEDRGLVVQRTGRAHGIFAQTWKAEYSLAAIGK